MSKLQVLGQAAVITSAIKLEDLKLLKKFKPEALNLRSEDEGNKKEVIFAVGVGTTNNISKFGITFSDANAEGNAQITIVTPSIEKAEEKKAFIKDNFGYALLNLNRLETQIIAVLTTTRNEFAAMDDSIQMM